MEKDTICAIATASGGAIGIIRVSGCDSIKITDKIFVSKRGKSLQDSPTYSLHYGYIVDDKGETIDEVMIATYHAPKSYTGEDSTEIMCHGSGYILQKVTELLIENGCRIAAPGEYTQRAFLNGKMDLSQAEAVADLIAASNYASHKLAMNQMRGQFSKELHHLRNQLLEMTSLLELELDFSEEDVEFADRKKLLDLSVKIEKVISKLTHSFRLGNAIKNGIPVAIIGETNVGKSTLLNQLLHEERAIVSDIHGTTRDSIEDCININGVTFRFIDTAGIRTTDDVIENIGIERTFCKIKEAEIVLWLIDATELLEDASEQKPSTGHIHNPSNIDEIKTRILPFCEDKSLICVINKCDLIDEDQMYTIYNRIYQNSGINENETIRISAKTGMNITSLENMLIDASHISDINDNDIIVTNIRHADSLNNALASIKQVETSLQQGLSGDLISEDLRTTIHHLSEIVGEVSSDDVLKSIFSRFCIGK
ncbi:MAG: tRNA uridine-5-carboxymethylaminomethyl(34) synthesis GTPase MnmE [Bacteroidaceae bacterium]|nr:tRNA uridine-5-carboxymethylaminomethyl(34) synthesis GTPase MnmE [Bacteroidaceae bacterium]